MGAKFKLYIYFLFILDNFCVKNSTFYIKLSIFKKQKIENNIDMSIIQ